MRMIRIEEQLDEQLFAQRAAKWFQAHEETTTYTDGEIEPGCMFALRFGLANDCVVVFRIDESCDVTNYQHMIAW